MKGRVLIVAGSDSGGGAGIQADIKAVTALGGFAMTAITALTAQNTEGVFAIHDVPADFLARQMQVVLTDIGADCVKIGMLHRPDIVEAVCDTLAELAAGVPVVVDPVMVAKGGASLLADDAMNALKEQMVPRAALLTPNLPEAEALTGRAAPGVEDAEDLAKSLLDLGPEAVLLKGGHREGAEVMDLLLQASGAAKKFTSPRIDTVHTHGTGCTLASAIACGIAQGLALEAAVSRARDYVIEAIRTAPGFGHGHGPLNHAHTMVER
ncbi:MAG: bifunctional hydroxymethylpyrimidine kinase/phosphomethylpyrimidine kinase [Rhodospirillales bacterium]|nr:bifunctional hydroxymethylpyrimidine kinase/phosphomethylpyrimidine kinase [Rhodospirillales bacterium]MDP6646780.1 bifunctional hydroxymethylpyrimidine kinase/phosphomethylpyrimidine kinase [Rhodospirillales bacterium]MDP6840798.1 bifunctional hydroxymethylpyrimidine kinase/phosphomethylpyrimidine kinase [Rhodospirillales bacterium]